MKFSPKFGTKRLGMIFTILGRFCSFLNSEGTVIRPHIRPRKMLAMYIINCTYAGSPEILLLCT